MVHRVKAVSGGALSCARACRRSERRASLGGEAVAWALVLYTMSTARLMCDVDMEEELELDSLVPPGGCRTPTLGGVSEVQAPV